MNANINRSHRRKLPVAMMATSATAARGTASRLRNAGVDERPGDADELGDDGEEVQDKEVPHAEPSPASPEPLVDEAGMANPGTAPSRTTISWLTMRTGISSRRVHSRLIC